MKAFNAALLGHAFGRLTEYAEQIAASDQLDEPTHEQGLEDISLTLAAANVIAVVIELTETRDAITRLQSDMKSSVQPITNVKLQYSLQHLLKLMKSEMDKRKVFAIDPLKSHYYQDDFLGSSRPTRSNEMLFCRNVLPPHFFLSA